MRKRILSLLLAMMVMVSVLQFGILPADAAGFMPRLSMAESNTPAYYTTLNPFYTSGFGMPNCTCYAYGRAYEILGSQPKLSLGNAGEWYDYNKSKGYYQYGKIPALGAIAVWKSTVGDAGHVAVVESIDGDTVITSESGWQSSYFWTTKRSASSPNFSASLDYYSFQGFIYILGNGAGPHTHDKGEFAFYEADHPHYNCYRCSICGEIWRDTNSHRFLDGCSSCYPEFTVIFDANGGNCSTTNKVVEQGSEIGSLPIPTRDGYVFEGWYTTRDGGTKLSSSYMVSGDCTVYAHWLGKKYRVSLNANGGYTGSTGLTATVGEKYGPLESPTLTGATFLGWYTEPSGGRLITADTIVEINDVTQVQFGTDYIELFAHWENIITTTIGGVTYIFDKGSGRVIEAHNLSVGGTITVPAYIDGVKVVTIGDSAFYPYRFDKIQLPEGLERIESCAFRENDGDDRVCTITIPSTVKEIESRAFMGCRSLEQIVVDGRNENYIFSDGILYSRDYKKIIYCCPAVHSEDTFYVRDGVETIEQYAFEDCSEFKIFVLSSSVNELIGGAKALPRGKFEVTVNLYNTSFVTNNDVLFTADMTKLVYCPKSKSGSYIIPDGVRTICEDAFDGCYEITKLTLPESLRTVEALGMVFSNGRGGWTTNLKSVIIKGYSDFYIQNDYGHPFGVPGITTIYGYKNNAKRIADKYGYSFTALSCAELSGHKWSAFDGNLIDDGVLKVVHSCLECGSKVYETLTIEVKKQPTCIEDGWYQYVCDCGTVWKSAAPKALGHNYVNGVCVHCGVKDSDYKPPHTHSYNAVITAPTCTSIGYTTHICACGSSYMDEYMNAIGHNFVNGACTICGEKDSSYKPPVKSEFSDVKSGAYYYDAVQWAVANEITNGMGNGIFAPDTTCTRGQIVTFLYRAAGKPDVSASVSFKDVKSDAYYYKAVQWAVANGITNGVGGDMFAPDATCTRAQVVTFLYRANNSPAVGAANSFNDVPVGAYYANAVVWAIEEGITKGTGNGCFSPDMGCTRAQVVTFLYRAQ